MMKRGSITAGAMESIRVAKDQKRPCQRENISFLDHLTSQSAPLAASSVLLFCTADTLGIVPAPLIDCVGCSRSKAACPQSNEASELAANVEVNPVAIDMLINCYSRVYQFLSQ
ncbi:hypothetical protein GALMADRAFT_731434 [Galerina marginata CBS 339.88]|uniref:Uncharacterized protein n=1 Tax=Galerina marginata (strain CBS 339.88) TaxID=685588 RepID=A0A067SR67_GALM3|nr:hypothetical protein GALMADRAFT_731434 [Galerina marginata CBS 339.88]